MATSTIIYYSTNYARARQCVGEHMLLARQEKMQHDKKKDVYIRDSVEKWSDKNSALRI